jgi:alpha-beta hydrolase superfamily lysophospholipase
MGGLIVLDYMVTRKPTIAGVISSAAAVKLAFEPSAALVFLGKITRSIFPSFTQNNGLNANHISRDEAVVKAYIADPLVHDKISSQLGLSMLEEGRKLQKFNGKLCCPLLIMHGTGDKLTSEDGSAAFAHNAKGDILYRSFEGLYHEIHNEPEKEQVLKTIWDWMESILKVQK